MDNTIRLPRLCFLLCLYLPLYALGEGSYSGGDGSPEDPYQISNVNDLHELSSGYKYDWESHFILTNDLDLDPALPGRKIYHQAVISYLNYSPESDIPDGVPFQGVFDGNGHTIYNLQIDGRKYLGLFGWIGSRGCVKNLTIGEGDITGRAYLGAIAGLSQGSIVGCYSQCMVTNTRPIPSATGGIAGWNSGTITYSNTESTVTGYEDIGGIVGFNSSGSTVACCYSKGNISGTVSSGGIVGNNEGIVRDCFSEGVVVSDEICGGIASINLGMILNCYSASQVTGQITAGGIAGKQIFREEYDYYEEVVTVGHIVNSHAVGPVQGQVRGGIVGDSCQSPECEVISCFWDIETTGVDYTSGEGVGLTTKQMENSSPFLAGGWDFANESENGTCDNWYDPPGHRYPELSYQRPKKATRIPFKGKGTERKPYLIKTADDFIFISGKSWLMDKHFRLVSDIDFSDDWHAQALIAPSDFINDESWIGLSFMGVFDGDGHAVSNIFIENDESNYMGLFGSIDGSVIKNLTVESAKIYGKDICGILAGQVGGGAVIENCSVQGWISGENNIGGLVGLHKGDLYRCSFEGFVNGAYDGIGGLAGTNNDEGNIYESSVKGSVSGREDIGGLVGYSNMMKCQGTQGTIQHCYSKGTVTGSRYIGGLVGSNGKDEWYSNFRSYGQSIENNYSHSNVIGHDIVGGLLGQHYWAGDACRGQSYTGLINSYFAGQVMRIDKECLGLIGMPVNGSRYWESLCYYDKEIIGNSSFQSEEEKFYYEADPCYEFEELWAYSTYYMKSQSTFLQSDREHSIPWDFENVWGICEKVDYPHLQWQVSHEDWICPDENINADSSELQEQQDLGLIHFDFETVDEDAIYSNVNGLTAKLFNMDDSSHQPGYFGDAFYFDGIDDYIELQGYKGIAGSSARSVGAWIKTSTPGGQIISWGQPGLPGSGQKWVVRLNDAGRLRAEVGSGNAVGTSFVSDGQWHHIMVVLQPGRHYDERWEEESNNTENLKLYVDGQLEVVLESAFNQIDTLTPDLVRIGIFLERPVYFEGLIDEVKIFHYPLDVEDIRQMIPESLVAHWKMDEQEGNTIHDSANGYDGLLMNMDETNWDEQEQALYFDGDDDFVEFSGFNGLSGGKTRTCSVWVKTDTPGKTIMSWGSPEPSRKWGIQIDEEGHLTLHVTWGSHKGISQITDNRWHHIAVTMGYGETWPDVGKNHITLYIDGVQDSLLEAGKINIYTSAEELVRLGHYPYRTDDHYKGHMSDVRVYDYALTSSEIRELANDGTEEELVAHWKLDEQQGMTAYDSASGYDGILTNMDETSWNPDEQALYFDGIDDYIEIPEYEGITGGKARTCSAWIKTDVPSRFVLSWGDVGTGKRWIIRTSEQGSLLVGVGDGYVVGMRDLADNQWHHILVELDYSDDSVGTEDIKLYVDGSPENIEELGSQYVLTASDTKVRIGVNYKGENSFEGFIKDVRIYNYPLNIDQIHALLDKGAVAYWKLDEMEGDVAYDSAGEHHGSLIDMSASSWYQDYEWPALSFNGVDDYIQMPGYKGITGTQSRTCTAWIKTTKAGSLILSWGIQNSGEKWLLRVNDSGMFRVSVGIGYILSEDRINGGDWTHVAVVLPNDGSPDIEDALLYINGSLNNGTYRSQPIDTVSGDDVKIGTHFIASEYFFDGLIRDVRIYDCALTEEDIKAIIDFTNIESRVLIDPSNPNTPL